MSAATVTEHDGITTTTTPNADGSCTVERSDGWRAEMRRYALSKPPPYDVWAITATSPTGDEYLLPWDSVYQRCAPFATQTDTKIVRLELECLADYDVPSGRRKPNVRAAAAAS